MSIILKYSVGISNTDVITTAKNGLEAVQQVKEDIKTNKGKFCSFDLILMDCNMPVMDGYEATKQIREFIFEAELP